MKIICLSFLRVTTDEAKMQKEAIFMCNMHMSSEAMPMNT